MLKSLPSVKAPDYRSRPRMRRPDAPPPRRPGATPAPASPAPAGSVEPTGGFDEESYFLNKQNKEKFLAEKAKIDAEAKRTKHAENIGTLVRADVAQRMLEQEHQKWLSAIDDWRQEICKRMGKLGIPIETQEAIAEMILKQTTEMRQKRAVA